MHAPEFKYARSSDGVSIAYAVAGAGPPILWLTYPFSDIAGVFTEIPAVRAYVDETFEGFRMVGLDPRGTGSSDRDASEMSLRAFVLDVEAVVRAERLDQMVLLGNNVGASIAVAYAVAHPERVRGLILHDGWIRGSDLNDPTRAKGVMALADADSDTFAQTLGRMTVGWKEGPATEPWVDQIRRAATDQVAFARVVSAMAELDASSFLPRVAAPALVLWEKGGNPFVREANVREIAAGIAGASLVVTEPDADGLPNTFFRQQLRAFVLAHSPAHERAHPASASTSSIRTILFTDLEGHTAMMSRLGDAKGRDVLREHERMTRVALAEHGGSEVKTLGEPNVSQCYLLRHEHNTALRWHLRPHFRRQGRPADRYSPSVGRLSRIRRAEGLAGHRGVRRCRHVRVPDQGQTPSV